MLLTIYDQPIFALYAADDELYNADTAAATPGLPIAYRVARSVSTAMDKLSRDQALIAVPFQDHPDAPGDGQFTVYPPGAWPPVATRYDENDD